MDTKAASENVQATNQAEPSATLPIVKLRIARRSDHPWIFQKMIEKPAQRLRPGTVVDIIDRDGRWVGRGFYNGHSRIGLRVLTSDPAEAIDAGFFERRMTQAIAWRRDCLHLDRVTNAYRLVHAEGDGLSGLVVDRFGDVLVLEFFAAGMYRFRELLCGVLKEHFPEARFYWFAEEHIQKQESFDCREPELPEPVVIEEYGVRFRVAPGSKHKTGFFLDQRDNRRHLAEHCAGKRVLDLCCNTGGFAIYAARLGQAAEVTGVDLDENALALARENAALNQVQVRFVQADIFPWLRDAIRYGKRWDVVVLDPSKQTRSREDVSAACQRYLDMNRLALQVVAPGGVFLSCSCTGLVSEERFLDVLRHAGRLVNRQLQIFRLSGAAADHPFFAHVPEGRYLKCVWCRVW
jgi:23S rRNA (cytosine1962-C5)-methyltransferase